MTITDKQCFQTTSGTSLTGTVTATEGDWVLATITTRDTYSLSSGWTTIYDSGVFAPENGNGQRMIFATQQALSDGTISITVTQNSAQRLYINLISISGIASIEFDSGLSSIYAAATTFSVPNKTDGDKIIWGLSIAYWLTTTPYPHWTTSPDDLTLVDAGTDVQSRQANFIDFGSGTASGRTFTQPTSSLYPVVIAAVKLIESYKTSGSAEYTVDGLLGTVSTSEISWIENVPENTSVSVFTSLDGVNWMAVSNGEAATPVGGVLDKIHVKIELATTDVTKTPKISDLSLVIQSLEDNKSIVLEMMPLERFESAAGNITVTYNGSSLQGEGGAVQPFTTSFTPIDLIPKPDQNPPEHIEITSTVITASLIQIYTTNTFPQDTGHVEVTGVVPVAVLTHVNNI